MKPNGWMSVLLWLCIASTVVLAAAQNDEDARLERVLKRMEAVGKTFRSFKAQFTQKKYTAVLDEFDVPESGEFYYARAKDGSALLRQAVDKPGTRILTIKGGVAKIYQPSMRQGSVVNLGKNKDKAEYLALGLGQSPARLQETFEIQYVGRETVNGASCSVISLKPRDRAAAAYFTSITLWISDASGIPIQQKLQEPHGDYLLVNFSGESLNTKIPDSIFEQKFPPGAEIQKIQ
jgi:outer membrane lipoprotein-sorting protein